MKTKRDKTLEELFSPLEEFTSTEEEKRKLQEIASGLVSMEKAEFSSSFHAELRDRLLQQAHRPGKAAAAMRDEIAVSWLKGIYQGLTRPSTRLRPAFIAVAAMLVIGILTVFPTHPGSTPGPEVADPEQSPQGFSISMGEETMGEETNVSVKEEPTPGNRSGSEVIERDPSSESVQSGESLQEGPGVPLIGNEATAEGETPLQEDPAGASTEKDVVLNAVENPQISPETNEPLLPEKPEFQIEREIRELRLSGTVILPPLYLDGTGEESSRFENVPVIFPPKYSIALEDAAAFGSSAWAAGLLKNEGFTVQREDSLEVVTQETRQGWVAEIFYQPGGKGSSHPVLILHCNEKGTILGYYYRETGAYLQAGCYPLVSPAHALKQARQMEVFSSLQPSLVFTEVVLTFSTFSLEENGRQQDFQLPAYCFTGRETKTDSEVKIYLPAISW